MSLYQKYRPKDFESLVGQEFVKGALRNALAKGKIVGAYLFYGMRGTGKTTVARILAKAINCMDLKEDGNPCLACPSCLAMEHEEFMDILEIDAASNTGVENIRELIEKAQFHPTQGKYKVYIIDEVHMLSKGAFNALLKTLEEPPEHVRFILATTEINKIPDTIISRTQRYDFRRISDEDVVGRLRYIAHNESIDADDEALRLIARLSKGGLRDAIAFFEQYSIGGSLRIEYLRENLQLVGDEFLARMVADMMNGDFNAVSGDIAFLMKKGIDVKIFCEEMIAFLHARSIENMQDPVLLPKYIDIYDLFLDIYSKIRSVPNTFMLLEYSVLKSIASVSRKSDQVEAVRPDQGAGGKESPKKPANQEKAPSKQEDHGIVAAAEHPSDQVPQQKKVNPPVAEAEEKTDPSQVGSMKGNPVEDIRFEIGKFIEFIRSQGAKGFVCTSLKASNMAFASGKLRISLSNAFNYRMIAVPDVIAFLQTKLDAFCGGQNSVEIVLEGSAPAEDIVGVAKDIF